MKILCVLVQIFDLNDFGAVAPVIEGGAGSAFRARRSLLLRGVMVAWVAMEEDGDDDDDDDDCDGVRVVEEVMVQRTRLVVARGPLLLRTVGGRYPGGDGDRR